MDFKVKGALILSSTIPEADFPMDFIPSHIKICGPLAMEITPAEELKPIIAWLQQAPTILINLGSLFKYNQQRAGVMADAIARLLEEEELDVQVLWKFNKLGDYDDSVFARIQPHVNSGRLKMERWLQADPLALLRTGFIALTVHHGGANCYQEAVLYVTKTP